MPGVTSPPKLNGTLNKNNATKEYDKDMVRKDFTDQTIHKYFGNSTINNETNNETEKSEELPNSTDANISEILKAFRNKTAGGERVEIKLTSVLSLRNSVENDCHTNLREILSTLIFVANVNWQQTLIQHQTKLYICNTQKLW